MAAMAKLRPVLVEPAEQGSREGPLKSRLAEVQEDIDAFLISKLPERQGPSGTLTQAMRFGVVGAGKRMRAMLTVAVAEMFDAPYARAIRVAAAIECVHAQSLIHDDLPCMDDDDMRRGKPSLHRQFDEAIAVLAGDALLALAFEILSEPATHPDANVRSGLVCGLARTIGQAGLAAGQMMDLYPPTNPTPDEVYSCEIMKTGGLIRFAVEAGAALGGCNSAEMDSLLRYADKLGLAFQIRDNVLDQIGDARIVGKRLRKDEGAGRKNSVQILGLGEACNQSELLAQGCIREIAVFGGNARILSEIASFAVSRAH